MPDLNNIQKQVENFSLQPSEGFVEKTNPLKLFYKAQSKLGPGASSAVGGVLGGLGGYYGSKALTNMAIGLMFAGKSPEEKQRLAANFKGNKNLSRIGAIVGALGGVYFGGGRDLDFNDWNSFKTSLRDPEYWKNKEPLDRRLNKFDTKLDDDWYRSKTASQREDEQYMHDIIPIRQSLDLIDNDLFLNPFQKNKTSSLIFGAEQKESGLTSGQKLTRSAINAGIGFVPAYAFGRVVGGVLGLNPAVRDRVSTIGGLAAAVINSGVIS